LKRLPVNISLEKANPFRRTYGAAKNDRSP
jgi:hypothetical protein